MLGGTKFAGLEFIKLLKVKKLNYYIGSRKKIDSENFIFLDRKNIDNLNELFSKHDFDIIIDFICYSSFDSKKLIDSLKVHSREPRLIVISSTYVYSNPLKLSQNTSFNENDFNARLSDYTLRDRPEISYIEGKKEMESYLTNYYTSDKLVILRFPIILGFNDYTKRTLFYYNKIKNKQKFNPKKINNLSNYIFSHEVSLSIYDFINCDYTGTYNIASKETSEYELVSVYCEFFKTSIDDFLDFNLKKTRSPFYVRNNFIIDSSKYHSIFTKKIDFKDNLLRELSKINVK